jgi:hypothetical protein
LIAVVAFVAHTLPSFPKPRRKTIAAPVLAMYALSRSSVEPNVGDTPSAYGNIGYSANVKLRLRVNGCLFPLAQVGHDRVMFDQPTVLPEGEAEVIVIVDDQEIRRVVHIDDRTVPRLVVPVTDA